MVDKVRKIETNDAPAAIGLYSQAVAAGDFIFVSGQIPIEPETGEVVSGDIREQTERVIKSASNILAAAGSGLEKVVKVEIFLTDLADFQDMNKVYEGFFSQEVKPARFVVQAAALPKGVNIEMACIAVKS